MTFAKRQMGLRRTLGMLMIACRRDRGDRLMRFRNVLMVVCVLSALALAWIRRAAEGVIQVSDDGEG
jgi:hypothetical protein